MLWRAGTGGFGLHSNQVGAPARATQNNEAQAGGYEAGCRPESTGAHGTEPDQAGIKKSNRRQEDITLLVKRTKSGRVNLRFELEEKSYDKENESSKKRTPNQRSWRRKDFGAKNRAASKISAGESKLLKGCLGQALSLQQHKTTGTSTSRSKPRRGRKQDRSSSLELE
jgi:hypothetical protein